MVLSLSELPEEILYNILLFCNAPDSVALGSTARRFRGVTNEPLLWRHYCQTHFRFWAKAHDMPTKLLNVTPVVDWKSLYISRHLVDRATSQLLDSIIMSQTGRIEKFRSIVSFGYDAKDTLLRNISIDSSAEDYLARRYTPGKFHQRMG
jgi:F-box protein 21